MVKIGIISDTHGLLREEVKDILGDCELILHGGDVDRPEILEELAQIAKLYVVKGNKDEGWASGLPESLNFEYAGLHFFMIHDREQIKEDLSDRDIIIFGHSHMYEEKRVDGKLWLNPGSCGRKRFWLPITMAVLAVNADGSYQVERIELSNKKEADPSGEQKMKKAQKKPADLSQMDRKELVKAIMRDMNHGKTCASMAKKYGISAELTEQICRLYVTHPGIDAEGIINKMGGF